MATSTEIDVRFWAKVEKRGPDECWPWKGAIKHGHKSGYGAFNLRGRHHGAHRAAWILLHGDPGDLCVLHRCDNRICVNPAHLFLGTKKDNADDMCAKGRSPTQGRRNKIAVLTESAVLEIRRDYKAIHPRKTNCRELAKKYGVTMGSIAAVIRRHTWKHVP